MRLSKRTETVTKVNAKGDTIVSRRNGYYPSGTPFMLPSEVGSTEAPSMTAVADQLHIGNRWLGHSGLDMYDNAARLHDPLLMRYASPDPLYGKNPDTSPWTHCAANPLNAIDPDGLRPIYDLNGNFMGTDDGGLAGDYVIMDEKNFSQNMAPELADKYAHSKRMLSTSQLAKLTDHYNNLPLRPDYDGYVTLGEANWWYRNGPVDKNGKKSPLYADLSQLDLSWVILLSYSESKGG